MPMNFSSQISHCDYNVRGATLPRMGSGEARGRRGSTGTHKAREAASEQRESHDKHKTPAGGKGSSKSQQHSGTGRIISHTLLELSVNDQSTEIVILVPLTELGDVLLYSRPCFPSGKAQREPDDTTSPSFMSCGDSRTKQGEQKEEVNQNQKSRYSIISSLFALL